MVAAEFKESVNVYHFPEVIGKFNIVTLVNIPDPFLPLVQCENGRKKGSGYMRLYYHMII